MNDTEKTTDPAESAAPAPMNARMMWAMMIGCCLAIPIALILGVGVGGGLAGASPWLIGLGVVLAVALVIARRISGKA